MKLTRITKIRGHRVFRDFTWPSDLPAFGQFNVIYGWNGCGKTTLASLLAHVEKRTVLSEGDLELEFDGSIRVAGTAFGSAQVPHVRVFNRDFINATLQSAGSGIAPIYYLGEDSVEKQAHVDQLKQKLAEAKDEVASATKAKGDADDRLDTFCVDQARIIKNLLTSANSPGYNNYDKRRFKQAAQGLSAQAASVALLSEEEKAGLRSQKDAQPRNAIDRISTPSLDVAALSKEVEKLVRRSVVAQTLDELTRDTSLSSWIQRGLVLHSDEHASETCRFCRQPFGAERRAALEAHFNDAFATFQREVESLLSKLKMARTSVGSMGLPETSRFYDHFVAEATAAVESVKNVSSIVEMALGTLIADLETKRDSPFAPASISTSSAAQTNSLTDSIARLNTVVEKHNKTTEDFQRSVREACEKLERCYVAEVHAEYLRLVEVVRVGGETLAKAKGAPATIQGEIDTLERQILEHRRPAEELTGELRAYLGRDELRFEVMGNGYALTRNGQPVSHLSEGERTAIAFLYFLKSLQDKTFDMAKGIVVIDDPVSSLDANSLFSAFGYMKERTKECGQLFIFTHSFPFFRLVKNWFYKGLSRKQRPGGFFLLRSCRHVDGSRTSQLGPLDNLLAEHESEYHYLFKRVYEETRRSPVDSLEEHYGLPNVARRLVEAFLAFRFPDVTGDNRLYASLERVSFDNAKKTRILRLLNTYSHGGGIFEPEHDLSLLAETQPVLLDVLELMKTVDKDHYEGLEKLMTSGVA